MHTFGFPLPTGAHQKTRYVINLTKHNFFLQFSHSFKWDMNILFPNQHNYPGSSCCNVSLQWQLPLNDNSYLVRNDRICKPRLFKEKTHFLSDYFTVNHCILQYTLDIPILKLLWLACWKGLQWCRAEYSISAPTKKILLMAIRGFSDALWNVIW